MPHPKQVLRQHFEDGSFSGDVVAVEGETTEGDALLRQVMRSGKVGAALPTLEECLDHCIIQRVRLTAELLDLEWSKPGYPVRCGAQLEAEFARLVARHRMK